MRIFNSTLIFLYFNALAMPKAVIIVRHGEKPTDKKMVNLNQKGRERAAALAPYFQGRPEFKKLKIDLIFAQVPNENSKSLRPIETITPTAILLDIKINALDSYTHSEWTKLIDFVKADSQCENKVILICWEHHLIYDMASRLGAETQNKKWHGNVFDRTLILEFNGSKLKSYKNKPQQLLYGDSKN